MLAAGVLLGYWGRVRSSSAWAGGVLVSDPALLADRRPRTLCSIAPAGGAGQSGGTESRTSSARSPVAGSPRTIAQSTSSSRIRLRSADTARARLAPTTAPEIRQPPSPPGRTWPRTSRFPSSCGAGTRHGPRRRRPTSHPYPARQVSAPDEVPLPLRPHALRQLRLAGDRGATTAQFHAITGQDVPPWMSESPKQSTTADTAPSSGTTGQSG